MAAPLIGANPVEHILENEDQRINITIYDGDGCPVDATALSLKVMDVGKNVLYTDNFFLPPSPPTRIVHPVGPDNVGKYYINWGDPLAPANVPVQTETVLVRDLFFVWRGIGGLGTEPSVTLQLVKIIDMRVLGYLPRLRLQIDKAVKVIEEEANIFVGFSDSQLLMYLEGGLNYINASYPSPTSIVLENFPFRDHGQILIDAATLVALQSQSWFAIDSDLSSGGGGFSDQGYSFAINHFQPLQSYLSALQAKSDKQVQAWKMQFATRGSIHISAGPSFRLAQLLQSGGPGMLFRGYLAT